MKISVIFSTYNSPVWLEKVLWGFECQTWKEFEVVIADDGSGPETREVVDRFRNTLQITHVWQEDEGFQKSRILNKAIVAATGDYLIFTDGDCIPRADFVETHAREARPNRFISGGYFMLPMDTSKAITREDIQSGRCFTYPWLRQNGLPATYKRLKLSPNKSLTNWLNRLTPTKPTWNGHNSSGWKKDLVAANGFNEEMQYGGQDRELGERLENKGVRGMQLRYSAICIHLDHKRGYKNEASIAKNKAIRQKTRQEKLTWTPDGIVKKA